MCGRYYIDEDTIREMEKLVRQIDKKLLEDHSRDAARNLPGDSPGLRRAV